MSDFVDPAFVDVLKSFDKLFEPAPLRTAPKFDQMPAGDYVVTVRSVQPKKSPTGAAMLVFKWHVDSGPAGAEMCETEFTMFIRNQMSADILGRGLASLGCDMRSRPFSEAVLLALPSLSNMRISLRMSEKAVGDKVYKNVYILGRAKEPAAFMPLVNQTATDGHNQEDCPF